MLKSGSEPNILCSFLDLMMECYVLIDIAEETTVQSPQAASGSSKKKTPAALSGSQKEDASCRWSCFLVILTCASSCC